MRNQSPEQALLCYHEATCQAGGMERPRALNTSGLEDARLWEKSKPPSGLPARLFLGVNAPAATTTRTWNVIRVSSRTFLASTAKVLPQASVDSVSGEGDSLSYSIVSHKILVVETGVARDGRPEYTKAFPR